MLKNHISLPHILVFLEIYLLLGIIIDEFIFRLTHWKLLKLFNWWIASVMNNFPIMVDEIWEGFTKLSKMTNILSILLYIIIISQGRCWSTCWSPRSEVHRLIPRMCRKQIYYINLYSNIPIWNKLFSSDSYLFSKKNDLINKFLRFFIEIENKMH